MSNKATEHKNEQLTVNVESAPGCKTTFKIEVSPEFTKKMHQQALKKINKQVSLPGFRKGRAPDKLIINHYGTHVEKEWKDTLLNNAFNESMRLTGIAFYTQEGIQKANIDRCSLDEGSAITIIFEAFPAVPEIETEDITLSASEKEAVTEEKVSQIIEDIRYRFAEWEDVEGRSVVEGDFVDVDIENLDEENEEKKNILKETRLEVKAGKIGKWLIDALVGLSPGESKEAVSSLEEGIDPKKFTPTNCRVTVKKIVKSTLPEVDDALAEKAGLKDIEELKEKVRADLEQMEESRYRDKRRELLREAILEKYPFEVPLSVAEPEAQRMMMERTKIARAKLKEGETLDEEESKELSEKVFREVNDYIRWEFITSRIVVKNGLEAEQREIVDRAMRYLYHNREQGGEAPQPNLVMQQMKREIEREAACDLLLEQIDRAAS